MSDIHGKSLTELGLPGLDDSPPDILSDASSRDTLTGSLGASLASIRNSLLAFVKSSKFKEFNYNNAWLCSNCQTVNGNSGNEKIIRKLCSKCKKARVGSQTVLEQILELNEQELDRKAEIKESGSAFDKVTEDLL